MIKKKKRKHSVRKVIECQNEVSDKGKVDIERSHSYSLSGLLDMIPLSKFVSTSVTVNCSSDERKKNITTERQTPL